MRRSSRSAERAPGPREKASGAPGSQVASRRSLLRELPSVDSLLRDERLRAGIERIGRTSAKQIIQRELEGIRREILRAKVPSLKSKVQALKPKVPEGMNETQSTKERLLNIVQDALHRESRRLLQKVINGTGVILHTNLGRAPLAESVVGRLSLAGGYINLEFDLEKGERGKRGARIEEEFARFFGAGEAIIVNNNASALYFILSVLGRDKPAIVSRGELVQIGGGFRIPEIIDASGAVLKEVGTTNRTTLKDYEKAIQQIENCELRMAKSAPRHSTLDIRPSTFVGGFILHIHRSNFSMRGFVESPDLSELRRLAKRKGFLYLDDLGSGNPFDLAPFGINEPRVQQRIRLRPDFLIFSGDKILGGVQAGIILTNRKYGKILRENPLMRVLRPDKMTYLAMEELLRLYETSNVEVRRTNDMSLESEVQSPKSKLQSLSSEAFPVLRMLSVTFDELRERAGRIISASGKEELSTLEVINSSAYLGGGSSPEDAIPSVAIAVSHQTLKPERVRRDLLTWEPPVIGYINEGRYLLDLRTVDPADDKVIIEALKNLSRESACVLKERESND